LEEAILDLELDLDADRRTLLERHKPLLRFDPQYDYRLLAVESAVENPGNILRTADGQVIARSKGSPSLWLDTLSAYPPGDRPVRGDCLAFAPDFPGDARRMETIERYAGRIYGRVVDGTDGRTWLQYWFWLYYNPKNLFGFGKHEGDWEMVQVGLRADGTPEVLTYAQHKRGDARKWDSRGVAFTSPERLRPVVYVATGSHASYFQPRTYPLLTGPLVLGIDHPRGDGPASDLPIEEFGTWARWPGKWGSAERATFGEGKGPDSPAYQGMKWSNPARWHLLLRVQRVRVLVGFLINLLGRLTFPRAPEITHAESYGSRLNVGWKMNRLWPRRHLYITAHEKDRVIASRVVDRAQGDGAATLLLPDGCRPDQVIASAFNILRQRSDLTRAPVQQAAPRPVADLHTHYPMHLVPRARGTLRHLLFGGSGDAKLRDRFRALLVGLASRFGNYRSFWSGPRVTVDSLRSGEVQVALSALYSFFDELALGQHYPAPPRASYLDGLLRQADLVERDIEQNHSSEAAVAHNLDELDQARTDGKIALIHCVEGGFHLGNSEDEVTEGVSRLATRGIAYVTVAHLVWRHVATDAPAIPFLPDWLYRRLFPQPDEGLSLLGQAAVKAMVDKHILIDLSHMSENSVRDTLSLLDELNADKSVPVIASHSCFRFASQEYALTEDTIRRIQERRGVIGLIMAQHQLRDGLSRLRVRSLDRSIEIICDHIDRIASVTGSYDNLGIGSDLDGFIKPTMGGIESSADMARLERALRQRYGEEIAQKICFGNAMRVLRAGWGNAGAAAQPGAPLDTTSELTAASPEGAPAQRV
jgi:microsomal dipeptidase-like Zn-dependent dipeptidase